MQRLNIPLNNSPKTTRRSRRVVWMSGILVLLLVAVAYSAAFWWFARQSLTSIVPEGTVAMIRFLPNHDTWPLIERDLANIPLISEKGLSVSDIRNFCEGELVIYVMESGEWALGIKGEINEETQTKFDQQGIVVQDLGRNRRILAQQLLPYTEEKVDRHLVWPNWPYWPGKVLIGELYLLDSSRIKGVIYHTAKGLEISLPKANLTALNWSQVPESSILALSTPTWSNDDNSKIIDLPHYLRNVDENLANFREIFGLETRKILITSDDEGMGILLETHKMAENTKNLNEILKLSAALHIPQIRNLRLPDNTVVREITMDPDSISIERTVILGNEWSRVSLGGNQELLAGSLADRIVISNRSELIRFWMGEEPNESKDLPCEGDLGFVNLAEWMSVSSSHAWVRNENILYRISENFSTLGITNGLFRSKISLCR